MGRRTYDVFISYNSKDQKVAVKVKRRLEKAGLKVYFDTSTIRGGDEFDEKIVAGLEKSRSIAVLVGPHGFGPWQKREIAQAAEDPLLHLIPVLLAKPRPGSRMPLAFAGLHRIDLTKGLDDKKGIGALVKAIKAKPKKATAREEPVEAEAPEEAKPKSARAISVRGNGNQVATNGGIIAGNVTGSVLVTGGGNNLHVGRARGR